MDPSFFIYLERLEPMGFFSGYPLLCALVWALAGKPANRKEFGSALARLLPYAYALAATLYLGLILRNAYPHYNMERLLTGLQQPWLRLWGLSALLFWLPFLARKPWLSFLHSLIFFFFIVRDILAFLGDRETGNQFIKNDMRVYMDSILILASALLLLFLITWLSSRISPRRNN